MPDFQPPCCRQEWLRVFFIPSIAALCGVRGAATEEHRLQLPKLVLADGDKTRVVFTGRPNGASRSLRTGVELTSWPNGASRPRGDRR